MRDLSDQKLILKTIRDVVGEAGLEALEAEKGGTEIDIGVNPEPSHWMSVLFGLDNAREISRRLTVFDADGKPVCRVRCYVSRRKSRLDAFRNQVRQETSDALLSGLSVRGTAKKVGVSEKQVRRRLADMIEEGSIDRAPLDDKPANTKSNVSVYSSAAREARRLRREERRQAVDEAILRGLRNSEVAKVLRVDGALVRDRRDVLLASGQIKPGPLGMRVGSEPATDGAADNKPTDAGERMGLSFDEMTP